MLGDLLRRRAHARTQTRAYPLHTRACARTMERSRVKGDSMEYDVRTEAGTYTVRDHRGGATVQVRHKCDGEWSPWRTHKTGLTVERAHAIARVLASLGGSVRVVA